MLIKKPIDIQPSEITPKQHYLDRRRFMTAAAAGGATILLPRPGVAASRKIIYQGVPSRDYSNGDEPTDYRDAIRYNNYYEFGTGKDDPLKNAAEFKARPWSVRVSGECNRPGELDLEDFLKPHRLEERIYRLRCVEAWSMVIPWVGFSLADALKRFEPNGQARFVAFRTLYDPQRMPGQKRSVLEWPYREGLRMDEAMHPLSMLAVGMYGEVMPNQNGAPMRLVVPWKYGFKSIKSIVGIEFTRKQPQTSWNMQAPGEYGFYSNVNPRVDHPRWSQKKERRIGASIFTPKRATLMFNGYGEEVASLYTGMDLKKNF